MSSKKMDRRKKYTRMVLKDSLLQLLKEKQFSAITVKEICETADINRSTFYAHYTDQYELLEKIEEEMIDDLNLYLRSYNFKEKNEVLQMTEKIIEYFSEKKDEVQILLNTSSHSSFQLKVMEVAHRYISKQWKEFEHMDEDLAKYLSVFIVSGSVQVIKLWLNDDDGLEKSPKEMALFINNLIDKGVYGSV
ncbi:TetR/AcrR family transcriptional regulator [Oceanobacillus sp. FSL H7-0719]|uniref:TetR/AcrR family transcriptional regulator n=1 Tax=Oceanobacillus sp. FSL H7-0719 TaxID=2954507 RepID=UPI00324E9914